MAWSGGALQPGNYSGGALQPALSSPLTEYVSDSFTISDGISGFILDLEPNQSDSLTFSDGIGGNFWDASASDSFNISDSTSVILQFLSPNSDNFSFNDTLGAYWLDLEPNQSDLFSIFDSIVVELAISVILTEDEGDSFTISDDVDFESAD